MSTNNSINTALILLGGPLTFSGAFTTTFTVTGTTSLTLPTSGTLVNTAVTTLSSLVSIGTITTGVWNATVIGATYGGTGTASPTIHTLPVAQGSSAFNFVGPLTNGQLLVGSTGADPVAASITAGSGITVTPGAGSITIAATGGTGFTWTVVTGTSQTMVAGNGYFANNASLGTYTLPTTASVGDTFEVAWMGAGGWKVAQNASQVIQFGSVVTTTGTGGSIASSANGDNIKIVCNVANTGFQVTNSTGNLTYV